MLGLMQDWPLLCHRIIDHAAINHGDRTVVTRSIEGPIHQTNYVEIRARALRVAQLLDRDGIKLGDRVATLAWNTWRHLASWYGILGIGAIYHTINPRLFPEQIAWIINLSCVLHPHSGGDANCDSGLSGLHVVRRQDHGGFAFEGWSC